MRSETPRQDPLQIAHPVQNASRAPNGVKSRLQVMFRALQYRNYRLFFMGQIVSLVGTWMQSVAQSWLVYRLTGSSFLLGLVGFCGQFPVFLMAPIGGMLADRWSRYRIVIATQTSAMLLAIVLAALTLLGHIKVWEIMALATLLGVVNAFDIPARQAFVPEMINPQDLINAIALNSSMVNGARMVGPAIAGLTVAAVGEGWCFFANGVSYIAVIVGLLLMNIAPRPRNHQYSGVKSVVEGFRWVVYTGPIRALLLLLGVVCLTGMPYMVLMPIFADPHPAPWRPRPGDADGGFRRGRAQRHAAAGRQTRRPWPWQMGHFCGVGFWAGSDRLRLFPIVPAFAGATGSCGLFHDDRDGRIEHPHPNHGSRRAARARDGGLLDDVHGDGALRGTLGGGRRRTPGGATRSGHRWSGLCGGRSDLRLGLAFAPF